MSKLALISHSDLAETVKILSGFRPPEGVESRIVLNPRDEGVAVQMNLKVPGSYIDVIAVESKPSKMALDYLAIRSRVLLRTTHPDVKTPLNLGMSRMGRDQ